MSWQSQPEEILKVDGLIMVGCPSSLLRYPIIAMAVDYDIKNENSNKNRRTGSDRPYKCHICYPRLHVLLECSSSHLADLLGQLGSMEKKEGNT